MNFVHYIDESSACHPEGILFITSTVLDIEQVPFGMTRCAIRGWKHHSNFCIDFVYTNFYISGIVVRCLR